MMRTLIGDSFITQTGTTGMTYTIDIPPTDTFTTIILIGGMVGLFIIALRLKLK